MPIEPPDSDALGRRAEAMIRALAAISADPERLTRLYLTPEHRRAVDLVAGWMREAGLTVDEDALGTLRGRLQAEAPQRLLIGSHLDTVIDAGAYDGMFGVIAGILAAGHLRDAVLPFGLDVLAFGDEEGSRFPATLCCSRAVAGVFDPAALEAADAAGVTLRDALIAYGKDPAAIAPLYRPGEALAFIEAHIEQGPVLEVEGEPLGVVTAIAGQTRLVVTLWGEAGHAGTVPMRLRRDALAGAAEIVLAVERVAGEHAADGMVTTVGRLTVSPGAGNVIPGKAVFSIDLRSTGDEVRLAALAAIRETIAAVAARRRLEFMIEKAHEVAATPCDPLLMRGLSVAVEAGGGRPVKLASGAGHDGQAMARLCPIAMLFLRCRGGISHNPAEYASPPDMGRAIAALIRFVADFDPRALARGC